jgi:hypothetical protein
VLAGGFTAYTRMKIADALDVGRLEPTWKTHCGGLRIKSYESASQPVYTFSRTNNDRWVLSRLSKIAHMRRIRAVTPWRRYQFAEAFRARGALDRKPVLAAAPN